MDSMNSKYFPTGWNEIGFEVNNERKLVFAQKAFDDFVSVATIGSNGNVDEFHKIPNGQFVMLWNLYAYYMKNNIYNDFVNPYGKNADTEAEEANKKIIEGRRKEAQRDLIAEMNEINAMLSTLSDAVSKLSKKISET